MTMLIAKTIAGKRHFLSVTGKWIRSTPGASVMCGTLQEAQQKAREAGGYIYHKRWRM